MGLASALARPQSALHGETKAFPLSLLHSKTCHDTPRVEFALSWLLSQTLRLRARATLADACGRLRRLADACECLRRLADALRKLALKTRTFWYAFGKTLQHRNLSCARIFLSESPLVCRGSCLASPSSPRIGDFSGKAKNLRAKLLEPCFRSVFLASTASLAFRSLVNGRRGGHETSKAQPRGERAA